MPTEQLELLPLSEKRRDEATSALTVNSSLHKAVEAFHAHMLRQDLSQHTIRAFDSDLRLLTSFVGQRTPISHISSDRLEAFLKYLRYERGVPCKLKSLARRLTTLKVFFGWLSREGAIPTDPAAPLVHHRATTPLPHVLSEQETDALLEVTNRLRTDVETRDARPHLLVTLLLSTGIKKGECMNIALTDIDTSDPNAALVFIRYESVKQRYKERKLRLSPPFAMVLPEYLAQYKPDDKLFECTARNLEYVLDHCSVQAGLPARALSFETLRWTCAVRNLKEGMDEDALRRKLGLSHITWAETLDKLRRLIQPAL